MKPINENELLQFLLKRANLNIDDVLKDVETMRRDTILKQHKETYKVWQAEDGRWKTKLPDGSKYGKLVAKSTLENLENCIVDFYKANEEDTDTLTALYPEWIEYKRKESSPANATKLQWVWDTYYKDSNIAKMKIKDIKTLTVKNFALDMIEKHGLTRKKYLEMKTVINLMLNYAVELEIVSLNVARNVRGINKHKYKQENKKSVNEQIFVGSEKKEIINLALAQYKKTNNTAYLAVCLNFYLGLRVGELVALHTNDFSDGHVSIHCEEIKHYCVIDGRSHRDGYEIADYTKTEKSTRNIICVSEAQKYYNMIVKANEARGFKGGFLLVDDNGNRMHDFAVNNVLRRLNKKIETPQKGNHSIRKTCISNMAESKLLTNEEIMDFAGHTNYATTRTYYIFSELTPEDRKEAYEKALCKSVTNCNKTA